MGRHGLPTTSEACLYGTLVGPWRGGLCGEFRVCEGMAGPSAWLGWSERLVRVRVLAGVVTQIFGPLVTRRLFSQL